MASDTLPAGRRIGCRRTFTPMDLLEYQGKQLFAKHGVPGPRRPSRGDRSTPRSRPRTRSATRAWSRRRCAIGKRGKAGGIKVAKDATEARKHAEAILGMDIRGFTVHDLWIEQASEIAAEYYASIILDRSEKKLLAMLSRMGGMDVEEMAETDPDALVKRHIEPGEEFTAERRARDRGRRRDRRGRHRPGRRAAGQAGRRGRVAEDATLIEVNPLIVTNDRHVVALDSKATIDGNALYRHPELAELTDKSAEDPQEAMAKEKGLTYVKLGGNIGILGNGAGLCMSTLDVVAQAGRQARELPRRRRRLEGGRDRRRARGDHLRSQRQRDPVQHLRRDHPLRRDRQGDHRGLAADGDRDAGRRPPRRHQLGARVSRILAEAELGNLHVEKTMLGAAKAVVELAGGPS